MKDCVDMNYTFCPAADHRTGKCYQGAEKPVYIDGCTSNITIDDVYMKYWYCNYNLNCTDNYNITLKGFGSASYLITLT